MDRYRYRVLTVDADDADADHDAAMNDLADAGYGLIRVVVVPEGERTSAGLKYVFERETVAW